MAVQDALVLQLPHLTASQEEEMRTDVLHLIHNNCFSKVLCPLPGGRNMRTSVHLSLQPALEPSINHYKACDMYRTACTAHACQQS